MEFRPFGKIPRLSRPVAISEKIDGTNASIFITISDSIFNAPLKEKMVCRLRPAGVGPTCYDIYAGSRTRWITPEDDNYGFATWVEKHASELVNLGPGHHFGEWWGKGIQRGYNLTEKHFSLFNTSRWTAETLPLCCGVVPVLYTGPFATDVIDSILCELSITGSRAAPGFMKPEGIVIYHTASEHLYKKTLDDDGAKSAIKKDPNTGGRRKGLTPEYHGLERRASADTTI